MGSKFNKSTDQEHTVTLESNIVSATWAQSFARGGHEIGVDVRTVFVGEGAKIKIKGKSENGKNLGKIDDVIYGNHYFGKLSIPENIKPGDYVYFQVKLPQNGIDAESNHIPAGPPIKVTNMKWDKKEARRGDILKLSADITEVAEGTGVKVVIFEYDADGNHDKIVEISTAVKNKKVELDWEYEYFEDIDEIPTQSELEKYDGKYNPPEYFFEIEIHGHRFGQNQESGLLTFKDYIEIKLQSEDGEAVANEKYILHLADGSQRQGQLDASGYACEKDIPPGEIRVEFPDSQDYS